MDQLNINNETGKDWTKAVSSLKDEFGGVGERLQRYIGDITKGWIIIVVAGLITSIVLSLVGCSTFSSEGQTITQEIV